MLRRIVNGMHLITSFTGSRGVRYPAPDVARGFMLLFVAVANVPTWNKVPANMLVGTFPVPAADAWWVFVRTLFVDHRAYPLFAMLFGFGLMTMINRRIASGTQSYLQSLPGADAGREPTPQEESWARQRAAVDARRLVRRRGAWMILFGFVHGIFFSGDIIGAYGLAAVILAGWFALKRYVRLYVVGAIIALTAFSLFLVVSFVSPETAAVWSGQQENPTVTVLPWFVVNIANWFFFLFVQVLVTLIVPAAAIGARLADTGIIIQPDRHRRLLISTGIGGLALGALAALHSALTNVLPVSQWPWDFAVKELFGLVGACGWLALLALYAGGPREDGRLTGLRRLASAVGRRSMTAYLSQTILFGTIFVIVPVLVMGQRLWVGQAEGALIALVVGQRLWVGQAVAALIALAVWLVTVGLCAALERGGHAGPFETLLRTAVARSERKRPRPAPPSAS